MKEIWKPINHTYEISNLGRVRNSTTGLIKKLHLVNSRYLAVDLWNNNKGKKYLVHRLVAKAFLGEPQSIHHEVNHKNSDRTDNRASNLEWVTRSENMLHANKMGHRTGNPIGFKYEFCRKGHLMQEPNLLFDKSGRRRCKTCRYISNGNWHLNST